MSRYSSDILCGLAELHSADCMMLDVKPGNVLLDNLDRAVLADFGLARVLSSEATSGMVSFS